MEREETLDQIIAQLGSRQALRDYVDAHSVDVDVRLPAEIGEVLGDFRPYGGIVVVGYEAGRWWDTDTSAPFSAKPNRWAPFPPKPSAA